MKAYLLFCAILIILGCRNGTSLETKSDFRNTTANHNFNKTGPNDTIQNDTLQVIVKITYMLPIGWGTKYKCEVQKVIKGVLNEIDSTFEISASVGDENIYKDIHFLKLNEIYFIEFVKSKRKTDESFIPSGTTGLLDKNGVIWDIIILKKSN